MSAAHHAPPSHESDVAIVARVLGQHGYLGQGAALDLFVAEEVVRALAERSRLIASPADAHGRAAMRTSAAPCATEAVLKGPG